MNWCLHWIVGLWWLTAQRIVAMGRRKEGKMGPEGGKRHSTDRGILNGVCQLLLKFWLKTKLLVECLLHSEKDFQNGQ